MPVSSRRLRTLALAIYLVAVIVRLILVFGFSRHVLSWPEPVKIASSIAKGKGFSDPYVLPTGPTAHSPPLYPLMIAPLYAIWDDPEEARRARMLFTTLAAGAEYALLPYVSRALGMGVAAGAVAGVFGAIVPLHHWLESIGEFETTWAALFLELSVMGFVRWLSAPRLSALAGARAGVWWALGLLLAPNLLTVLVGFAVVTAWRLRGRVHARAAARWVLAFTLAASAIMAPWFIRNYVRLGGVFFVRDNFGLEMYVSNGDHALADVEKNVWTPFFQRHHPHPSRYASAELIRVGEARFNQERLRDAIGWIRTHPDRFARLTAERVAHFWFSGEAGGRANAYARWAILGWAFIGLAALWRSNRPAATVLTSILASYPLVYYLVANGLRYQHPIYWVILLLGAGLAVRVGSASWHRLQPVIGGLKLAAS